MLERAETRDVRQPVLRYDDRVSDVDPVRELAHDHADLNRRVLELGAKLAGRRTETDAPLDAMLSELREHLFLHFAREEEALFPLVAEELPDLAERVDAMAVAHDAICGALARMIYMVATGAQPSTLWGMFERFETAYAAHAAAETELLRSLEGRLDAEQQARLAELVRSV